MRVGGTGNLPNQHRPGNEPGENAGDGLGSVRTDVGRSPSPIPAHSLLGGHFSLSSIRRAVPPHQDRASCAELIATVLALLVVGMVLCAVRAQQWGGWSITWNSLVVLGIGGFCVSCSITMLLLLLGEAILTRGLSRRDSGSRGPGSGSIPLRPLPSRNRFTHARSRPLPSRNRFTYARSA